jgi:hypothetical protein
MSAFYDNVLLREEFNLVQKLQKDTEFAKYVTVKYEDRVTGETRPVVSTPTADKYPEVYIVDYKMPVYVAEGRLRNDFHGHAKITLSEPVLTNKTADHGPHVEWRTNCKPFNNHVSDTWVCNGNGQNSAWAVAKNLGLWHFIIVMGKLINQEPDVSANAVHMSSSAYDYWVRRGRKPVTNINWPLDLLTKPTITVTKATTTTEKPKISIVKKMPEQQPTVKKITIIKK